MNRNRRRYRNSLGPEPQRVLLSQQIEKMLAKYAISASEAETEDFIQWMLLNSWTNYQDHCMDQRTIIENEVNSLPLKISNAIKDKPYTSEPIQLPPIKTYGYQIEGIEELGLIPVIGADGIIYLQGTPTKAGDFTITIKYKYDGWIPGRPVLERKLPFAVNPNPRDLWKNIPTSQDVVYYKPDQDCEYVTVPTGADGSPRKDMVAASNRGRSHAQEGKPRDDHFQLLYCPENEWYIMAVADGAGSAKYSRKGSEVACRKAVEFCQSKLKDAQAFEAKIRAYQEAEDKEAAQKAISNDVYTLVGNAAFLAHKAINEVSKGMEGAKPKDFATTLMLAICKKFDFGWFIASYWVGDGAMAVYSKDANTIKLLGIPDEGEYSGQTRFLTMPEIFQDHVAISSRLRFHIVDDFTALMLMTDGVSDPMFGTDVNLNDIERWHRFWKTLQDGFPEDGIPGVVFADDREQTKYELLSWLDFWIPGEHDDRTIAILY